MRSFSNEFVLDLFGGERMGWLTMVHKSYKYVMNLKPLNVYPSKR